MIRIRNVWGALVIGACAMSGCAIGNSEGARGPQPLEIEVQAAALSCPSGTISVCNDRLPRAKACSCVNQQALEVPANLSLGGFSR